MNQMLFLKKIIYLPNTAGCYNAEEAIRTLQLAREAGGWNLVKLEVIGDKINLYPNMIETLKAAKLLVKDNFQVMAYCSDDPILAKKIDALAIKSPVILALEASGDLLSVALWAEGAVCQHEFYVARHGHAVRARGLGRCPRGDAVRVGAS